MHKVAYVVGYLRALINRGALKCAQAPGIYVGGRQQLTTPRAPGVYSGGQRVVRKQPSAWDKLTEEQQWNSIDAIKRQYESGLLGQRQAEEMMRNPETILPYMTKQREEYNRLNPGADTSTDAEYLQQFGGPKPVDPNAPKPMTAEPGTRVVTLPSGGQVQLDDASYSRIQTRRTPVRPNIRPQVAPVASTSSGLSPAQQKMLDAGNARILSKPLISNPRSMR